MPAFEPIDVENKSLMDIFSHQQSDRLARKYDWTTVMNQKDSEENEDLEETIQVDLEDDVEENAGEVTETPAIDYDFSSPYLNAFYRDYTPENRPAFSTIYNTSQDLGYRNSNPGNLKIHEGWTGDSDGKFKVYKTLEQGKVGLLKDIKYKIAGKSAHMPNTTKVKDFFKVYAPSTDNNDPVAYSKSVVEYTGIDPEIMIKDMTEQQIQAFAKGIIRVESPNSYIYLYDKKKRDEVLAQVLKDNTSQKMKGGGILYTKLNNKYY